MKEFGGRVAVVTGAAGGMGCALNQSKAELRTEGTTVLTVPKDIPRRTP